MNQLIRCVKCDEIFLQTPFDQWPEYGPSEDPLMDSLRTTEKDDFGDFLRNHHGHRLEDLKIIEDSFVSEKDYSEPIKTSYFKATNGKESFLIMKSRETISEPTKYELIPGDLLLKCTGIQIQSKEIEKQLERELELPNQKIAAFVRLYQRIADGMEIGNLERVPEESANPLEVYYTMDDISLAFLLRNCRNIFEGQQYLDIKQFIEGHKEDGVLLLKATFQIRIAEKGKSKSKAPPPALLMESRKSLKKEES
jgi:hypothetical protein